MARKTYIACWNPDSADTPFVIEKYYTNLLRHKQWVLTHDVRWRSSICRTKDNDCDNPKGAIYAFQIMRSGDRMFVLRTGSDNPLENMLVHSGFFTTDPYIGGDWRDNYKLLYFQNFHNDVILPPNFPTRFTAEYLAKQFPKYEWSGENRGFVLDDVDALELELQWYEFFSQYDRHFGKDSLCYCQCRDSFTGMYEWQEPNGTIEHGQAKCYIEDLKKIVNK